MPKKKQTGQEPATKADLKPLMNRLDSVENRLGKVETTTERIALKLMEHDQKFEKLENLILQSKSEILSVVDAFTKDTKEVERDVALQGGHLGDHDKQLKDHENRLNKLETAGAN